MSVPKKKEIGQFRFEVEVFKPGRTSDGAGGSTRADLTQGKIMANVRPASASEEFKAQRLEMTITHVIEMRQLIAVGHNYTIKDGDKSYRVIKVLDEDNRKRFWTIWAVEGGAT